MRAQAIVKQVTEMFSCGAVILQSEIFARSDGSLLQRAVQAFVPHLKDAIQPVRQCIVEFHHLVQKRVDCLDVPMRTPAVSRVSTEEARKFCRAASRLSQPELAAAVSAAREIGDAKLAQQVSFVAAWVSAVHAGLEMRMWMLENFVEGAEYPKRRIQASIMTLIKKARGCRQAVEVAAAISKITLSSLEQALHLADFD